MDQIQRVMKYLGGMQDRSTGDLHNWYYMAWRTCFQVMNDNYFDYPENN
jgi:hypothetical protein